MADTPAPPRTMEARLPCPVCLGVQMEKVQVGAGSSSVVLDHCTRCGGVFFERGEVQQVTRYAPTALWQHIPPLAVVPKPPCHGCRSPLDRDAERCGVCGRSNEIACPVCERTMQRRRHGALVLDVCAHCKAVWFDHAELRSLWSLSVSDLDARRGGRGAQAAAIGGDILLESLFWTPGLVLDAGAAAASGVGHLAGALGSVSVDSAAGAALGAADAIGGAAEGVFSAILEIISSIFDGA